MISTAPPHNLEAEQAVLGSLLLDHDAVARVVPLLRGEDFYRDAHRRIYETMTELFERGEPVDLITVTDRLRDIGHLDDAGGAAYITSLLNSVPTSAHVEYHAHILLRDGIRRSALRLGGEIAHAAQNGHAPEALVALAGQMVENLRERLDSVHSPIKKRSWMNRIDGASLAAEQAIAEAGWFPFLRQSGILGRERATLISAHGKVGKTTMLMHACRPMLADGLRVLWCTEESRRLWAERVRHFSELAVEGLSLVFLGTPWPRLIDALAEEETDVVIIDTVRAFCGIGDENDQSAVSTAIQPLILLGRRKGWAVLLVHHLRKSEAEVGLGHAGSHAFVGLVDIAVEMHRDKHSRTRRLCKTVSRFSETPAEWVLDLRDDEMRSIGEPRLLAAAETIRRVEAILDGDARTFEDIGALLDPPPSRGALHNALATLVRENRAVKKGEGGKKDPYRWTRSQSFIHDLSSIRELNESTEGVR